MCRVCDEASEHWLASGPLVEVRPLWVAGSPEAIPPYCAAGGAIYLIIMSRELAVSCALVTGVMWMVALRYGNFQRRSQRLFQDALADTGQASAAAACHTLCAPQGLACSLWKH